MWWQRLTVSVARVAYAFIGIPGIGENNGIFTYKYAEKSCVEISTKVINGIPQGFNTGTPYSQPDQRCQL